MKITKVTKAHANKTAVLGELCVLGGLREYVV